MRPLRRCRPGIVAARPTSPTQTTRDMPYTLTSETTISSTHDWASGMFSVVFGSSVGTLVSGQPMFASATSLVTVGTFFCIGAHQVDRTSTVVKSASPIAPPSTDSLVTAKGDSLTKP